jgi:hypothetical protein
VKRIPLYGNGNVIRAYALVDDGDFEDLNQHRWCLSDGRAVRTVLMHRQIMGERVDHRDRDPLNNRRENLRPATLAQNNQNKGLSRANKSGYRGVSWNKKREKWEAQAKLNYRSYHLGRYDTPEEADEAVKALILEKIEPHLLSRRLSRLKEAQRRLSRVRCPGFCTQGHKLTPDNLYGVKGKQQKCRACTIERGKSKTT